MAFCKIWVWSSASGYKHNTTVNQNTHSTMSATHCKTKHCNCLIQNKTEMFRRLTHPWCRGLDIFMHLFVITFFWGHLIKQEFTWMYGNKHIWFKNNLIGPSRTVTINLNVQNKFNFNQYILTLLSYDIMNTQISRR